MKKRFVFWIAKILKVKVFEKETTEIVHRTTQMKFSRIEIQKIMPLYEVVARMERGESFRDLRNEFSVELATKLIKDGKVVFEQFEDQISRMHHFKIYIEAADQENNER